MAEATDVVRAEADQCERARQIRRTARVLCNQLQIVPHERSLVGLLEPRWTTNSNLEEVEAWLKMRVSVTHANVGSSCDFPTNGHLRKSLLDALDSAR